MGISLEKMGRFLVKLWWIIIIVALIGAGFGYFTATKATSETTYVTIAKITADMDKFEEQIEFFNNDSSDFNSSTNVYDAYNAAYALFTTYRDIVLSRETVLQRASEEYYLKTGKLMSIDEIEKMFWLDFPGGSLSFSICCQNADKDLSREMCEIVSKYGVNRLNEFSDFLKLELSAVPVCTTSITLTGDNSAILAFKQKVDNESELIYSAVKAILASNDSTKDEYLQRADVENGFSFLESNGEVALTFKSSSSVISNTIIDYVTANGYNSGLTVKEGTKISTKEYINDISQKIKVTTTESNTIENVILHAVLSTFIAFVVICIVYVIIEVKKNSQQASSSASEESDTKAE